MNAAEARRPHSTIVDDPDVCSGSLFFSGSVPVLMSTGHHDFTAPVPCLNR